MTVYEVWDYDPMASSMGEEYLAETFRSRTDAEEEVVKRNQTWRDYWVRECGELRAKNEPWNWRHARMNKRTVK